jgi:DNA repair protein RadD
MAGSGIVLRDYQRAAVDAVFAAWDRGSVAAHPLIEVPTGGGKSAIIGELVRRLVEDYGARVVVATHRKELIEQDARAIWSVWPTAPVGIWSAGLGKKDWDAPIVVGGVQTMARSAGKLGHRDVVLVDEAHLVPPDSDTLYGKLLRKLEDTNPDVRRVGLTATPYRLDQGLLTEGKSALFTCIPYRVGVRRLIDAGYIAPLTTGATVSVDTSSVSIRAGEFAVDELDALVNVEEVNDRVAKAVADALRSGRRSALLFATSIDHARALRLAMMREFVTCEIVTGETPKDQRRILLEEFKAGRLPAIANCDVLTTGFDAPIVDVLALVRPTMSPSLYVQMVGRGMRLSPGKRDCLVLDFGGNIARHGPVDAVDIVKPGGRKKLDGAQADGLLKICPSCFGEVNISVRVCKHCDHEFPAPERKATHTASGLPILSWAGDKPHRLRHPVSRVEVYRHQKKDRPDAPPTLRVEYLSGGDDERGLSIEKVEAREWVCLEHGGFARSKAEQWWARNVGTPPPATVDDAIYLIRAGYMGRVVAVETEPDGEYRRVVHIVRKKRAQGDADAEGVEGVEGDPLAQTKPPWEDDESLPF